MGHLLLEHLKGWPLEGVLLKKFFIKEMPSVGQYTAHINSPACKLTKNQLQDSLIEIAIPIIFVLLKSTVFLSKAEQASCDSLCSNVMTSIAACIDREFL